MNVQPKSAKVAIAKAPARLAPPVYQPCPAREVVQARMMASNNARMAGKHAAPQTQKPIQPLASVIMPARRLIAGAVETRPAPPAYRPQVGAARTVNPKSQTSAQQPIQRYTDQTVDELGGEGVMSENSNYFVANADTNVIWATSQPRYSRATGKKSVTIGAKTYSPYFSERLVRDCLHTAEEIIWGETLTKGEVRSKIAGTSAQFGESEKKNIAAATKHALDDTAAPSVGQAYAIVNTIWGKKGNKVESPYHAAAVVAIDGNDRITAEVFANDVDASKHGSLADYRIYTTGAGMGDTFHTHWQSYFGKDSATVVIEKV